VVQRGKRADSIVENMLLHSREGSSEHPDASDSRQSRSGAHFNVVCREAEPYNADGYAAVYAPHERVLKEIRESLSRLGDLFLLVQLGSYSQDAWRDARNGGWRVR